MARPLEPCKVTWLFPDRERQPADETCAVKRLASNDGRPLSVVIWVAKGTARQTTPRAVGSNGFSEAPSSNCRGASRSAHQCADGEACLVKGRRESEHNQCRPPRRYFGTRSQAIRRARSSLVLE
jgi:hypothetical protein